MGNRSKGPKDRDIEVEKKPLTKGRGRGGRETEKDKAEQDADTRKKQRGGPPKKKAVAMLKPALLEDGKLHPPGLFNMESSFRKRLKEHRRD